MKSFSFLLGAGVDSYLKLPLGNEYTLNSILTKKESMYSSLKEFYKTRTHNCHPYRSEFLFKSGSHTFTEMFISAAINCKDYLNDNNIKNTINSLSTIRDREVINNDDYKKYFDSIKDLLYTKKSNTSIFDTFISNYNNLQGDYKKNRFKIFLFRRNRKRFCMSH